VTRDPERIDRVLAAVADVWRDFPDWRLGQLIGNFANDLETDPYYLEDDRLEARLRAFMDPNPGER
jgi:hypothetical protein